MRKRKPPPEPQEIGCPEWMITFSDVISLLVTFFVLILTFSTLELLELKKLSGSLRGAFGVMTSKYVSNHTAVASKDQLLLDRERDHGLEEPFVRTMDDLEEDVGDLVVQERLDEEIRMDRVEDGLRIRIEGDRLFEPNSDRMRPDFLPVIEKLGDLLSHYPNEIVVEGHTDSTFTDASGHSKGPVGFELAGAMAQTVVEALLEQGGMRARKIGAASYGASEPIASNATASGRSKNRRVDILVLKNRGEG